jgi:hypothetical protein
MRRQIVLPELRGFRLIGFDPIFAAEVSMKLETGPYIVFGGNGLGKTTLMQAIVYGLAGPADDNIWEEKTHRWAHDYFRSRLTGSTRGAYVEVDFALGSQQYTVRRGFAGSHITAFLDGTGAWVYDRSEAQDAYAQALLEDGGYERPNDFAFVVHRLLYLPESRKLLAWDLDAQVRLMMLINQDLIDESVFREKRKLLKQIDSKKRHAHVRLVKATTDLRTLLDVDDDDMTNDDDDDDDDVESDTAASPPDQPSLIEHLLPELRSAIQRRAAADQDVRAVSELLTSLSDEVERLQSEIENAEATLVAEFLSEEERDSALAIHCLLHNGNCPVCGVKSLDLRAQAQLYAQDHLCVFCGSDQASTEGQDLGTLRSRLAEKLTAQRAAERDLRQVRARASALHAEENDVKLRIDQERVRQPVAALLEHELSSDTTEELRKRSLEWGKMESEFASEFEDLREDLEEQFVQFSALAFDRTERLRLAYGSYAHQFLGLQCDLVAARRRPLLDLIMFIPRFGDIDRSTPESCSEAQRFFLDIAFRMALIDLATEHSSAPGVFLCETPETALDMSYVTNVSTMFEAFCTQGHTILLTANIQPQGLGAQLLQVLPVQDRPPHVLNLLELGRLSEVHAASLPQLTAVMKEAMGVDNG